MGYFEKIYVDKEIVFKFSGYFDFEKKSKKNNEIL